MQLITGAFTNPPLDIGRAVQACTSAANSPARNDSKDIDRIAVAVSGGSDSLALLLLLAHHFGPERCVALTVDHGLRSGVAGEIAALRKTLDERGLTDNGLEHQVLTWAGDKPVTGVQAAARTARYRLLVEWCSARNISLLATGHTADDQLETVLMRLSRGAGLAGLSGVRAARWMQPQHPGGAPVLVIRPLLESTRTALQSWLHESGISWSDDPSNGQPHFERVRMRDWLADRPADILPAVQAARSARHLASLEAELLQETAAYWAQSCKLAAGFMVHVPTPDSAPLPEIGWRALARAVQWASGSDESVSVAALHGAALTRQPRVTLSGAVLQRQRAGGWLVYREAGRISHTLPAPCGNALWDQRLRVTTGESGEVRALGRKGWQQAARQWPELAGCGIPAAARAALPALWHGQQLKSIGGLATQPHAGWPRLTVVHQSAGLAGP